MNVFISACVGALVCERVYAYTREFITRRRVKSAFNEFTDSLGGLVEELKKGSNNENDETSC